MCLLPHAFSTFFLMNQRNFSRFDDISRWSAKTRDWCARHCTATKYLHGKTGRAVGEWRVSRCREDRLTFALSSLSSFLYLLQQFGSLLLATHNTSLYLLLHHTSQQQHRVLIVILRSSPGLLDTLLTLTS